MSRSLWRCSIDYGQISESMSQPASKQVVVYKKMYEKLDLCLVAIWKLIPRPFWMSCQHPYNHLTYASTDKARTVTGRVL
jgi:hypothetical protein